MQNRLETTPCDTLIHAEWVLPIAPSNVALREHGVAIQDEQIVAIGPSETLRAEFQPTYEVSAPDSILTPGLINAHTHAAMCPMRGCAEDQPLQEWLTQRIWPLEAQLVDAEYVSVGSRLAIAEMLTTGITGFADMYFYPEVTAEATLAAGMRARVSFPIMEAANRWSSGAQDCISKGLDLHDRYRHNAKVQVAFGPHSPYTVERGTLEQIVMYADEIEAPVHMHVHENAQEVAEVTATLGSTWLPVLDEVGLLGPRLQAIHMTQLSDVEIELVATRGVSVVHCPTSNMKLASGACRYEDLQKAGVTVALGTDSATSNNRLNLLAEARLAALLAKHETQQAAAGNAHQLLAAATIGGARALGWDASVGSIEPGKQADLALFTPTGWGATPCLDPFANLLHANDAYTASHVWVAGAPVVSNGEPVNMDIEGLRAEAAVLSDHVRQIVEANQ